MGARLVIAVVLLIGAVIVALVIERRRRPAVPSQGRDVVPHQLDRNDFPRPDAPWLVVLWSSSACESCAGLVDKLRPLESPEVAVVEIEYQSNKALHARYQIEAAPITQVVDAQGVTEVSFTGSFEASELWSVVAALRDAPRASDS
jgi:hypothetical protein